MDPETKNATQPFVYDTNKAVTKERERHFPSLFEASFYVSCTCDPLLFVFIVIMSHRKKSIYVNVAYTSSRYLFLVLPFPFLPFLQSSTSFRSSPSAIASVDHKLSKSFNKIETRTTTKTTTTTATRTTNTSTCNKITTTVTTPLPSTMTDNFVFDAECGEETSFQDALPRTTPLGTEMIFYNFAEGECGVDVRSAFPPSADVKVADACLTAYVGDGRLVDVRHRSEAETRGKACCRGRKSAVSGGDVRSAPFPIP